MKNKAINALIEMGASASNKGFHYIVDAMVLFENDAFRCCNISALYGEIAKMHNTSCNCVERCIRHQFQTILTKENMDVVEKYLSFRNTTNGNLLHVLYSRLTQED